MEKKSTAMQVADVRMPVEAKARGKNYVVEINGQPAVNLIRDVDFGVIPGTTKPTLFKSGAERILFNMGICSRFTVENAIEKYDGDEPFFMYRVKCSLFRFVNGEEVHITDGMGSANSNEKQCGRASKYDLANSRLKIAKKRAMVDACLLVGQLSNAFSQDIENEDFVSDTAKIEVLDEDAPITSKQASRIYAIAGANGIGQSQAKKILKEAGYASSKDIKQKDYDAVCELFQKGDKA